MSESIDTRADSDLPTILHVDMDAFFAAVAERDDPSLRGRPVVVGMGVRGVVSSANYAARKLGIHSAMPVSQARRLAPHAAFVPVDHARYSEVSSHIMEIFRSVSPLVEPLSLDEAFIDVTGSRRLLGSGQEIGALIRKRVEEEEKITCSVGVATSKFIAKLASTYCKPNGMLEIDHHRVLEFLHPLPVSAIWGVGPKTNEELQRLGLRTVKDIAETPRATLVRALGQAAGEHLHELAWGRDYRPVILDEPDRSVSAAETFSYDIDDPQEILKELLRMTERSTFRLRQKGLKAQTISIKVRFADFKTINRSRTVNQPINSVHECYEIVKKLYLDLKLDRARIRLVGVSLDNLHEAAGSFEQLSLDSREHGWGEATEAMDKALERFGRGSVRPASLLPQKKRKEEQGDSE